MKKTGIYALLGYMAGLWGAVIFEPIDGVLDILLSDYAIGGILVGILNGFLENKASKPFPKILISIGIGLVVFLVFSLISKHYLTDLTAGGIIGLLVGLASLFYNKKKAKTA